MEHDKEFINASDFIERNPDPVFNRAIEAGFEFWYEILGDKGNRDVWIKASKSDVIAGKVHFAEDPNDPTSLSAQDICVQPALKRRGVATAMCILVIKIIGKPLRNDWDESEMEDEGKIFWEQIDRLQKKYFY